MLDLTTVFIKAQSEVSVVVYFGDIINESILHTITSFNAHIHRFPFSGFIETVPAYTSLTIFYDPIKVLNAPDLNGEFAFERVINYIKKLPASEDHRVFADAIPIIIPVCYGKVFGQDIEEVARHNKLTTGEVIHLHSQPVYTVYMLGFMPGFPYLGGMNKLLATPRKGSPRKMVPAGSIGIAGEQTGVYPLQSPGGWQLIGRTPLTLFDPHKVSPSLLHAGDRVKFAAITEADFTELSN